MAPDSRTAARAKRRTRALPTLLATLLPLLAALGSVPGRAASQVAAPVSAVDSVALTVSDAERAAEFYSRVLGFERVADRKVVGDEYEQLLGVRGLRLRAVRIRLGDEYLELLQFLAPRGRPIPADSRSNDRWFQHVAIVVSDMSAAYARLRRFQVEPVSSGPQRLPDWNPDAGGIEAFYFHDPDGHTLEVLAFPLGKGAQKWHAPGGALFLGIDHTAIVVADTRAALRFYRDTLGLRVTGTSENYGTEQEHLNNVVGAHLRITTLRAAQGPGVELLEYLAPSGGRAMPADTQANDLWYWQIEMRAAQPRSFAAHLERARAGSQASRAVRLRDAALGWESAVVARDPDRHTSLIAGARSTPGSARAVGGSREKPP